MIASSIRVNDFNTERFNIVWAFAIVTISAQFVRNFLIVGQTVEA